MATYHCNIKVGKCGKTIPHFGYIMRKGKYEERKDLQYAESGNMPEWAETPEDFGVPVLQMKEKEPIEK